MIALLAPLLFALQDERESLTFRILNDGQQSGFQAPMEKFVSSEKDWVSIWTEREGNVKNRTPHPRIDFDKFAVVVVAMGKKNTGGYAIEITRVVKTKDDIQIFLKKTVPKEGGVVTQKVTSPFVLARIEKPDRPVTFLDEPKK
jgi:hypothetical protein